MQTVTLNISDDFMPKFLDVLESFPESKVKVKKDSIALELEKRVREIEDGSNPSLPFEEGLESMKARLK
ncbi:MAG: hypothetical protein ACLFQJ_08790 [Campylobacterales bacterium]